MRQTFRDVDWGVVHFDITVYFGKRSWETHSPYSLLFSFVELGTDRIFPSILSFRSWFVCCVLLSLCHFAPQKSVMALVEPSLLAPSRQGFPSETSFSLSQTYVSLLSANLKAFSLSGLFLPKLSIRQCKIVQEKTLCVRGTFTHAMLCASFPPLDAFLLSLFLTSFFATLSPLFTFFHLPPTVSVSRICSGTEKTWGKLSAVFSLLTRKSVSSVGAHLRKEGRRVRKTQYHMRKRDVRVFDEVHRFKDQHILLSTVLLTRWNTDVAAARDEHEE